MNKEQMQQGIEEMRKEWAEMEAKLKNKKKEKEKKYFIPEAGYHYWTLDSWGAPYLEVHDNEPIDIHRIASGNCYETPEEALKADAKQKAYVRIVRALRDHEEEGEELDSFIYYSSEQPYYNLYRVSAYNHMMYSNLNKELFSTFDACKWVIDNMKDDLNLYFGVEQ